MMHHSRLHQVIEIQSGSRSKHHRQQQQQYPIIALCSGLMLQQQYATAARQPHQAIITFDEFKSARASRGIANGCGSLAVFTRATGRFNAKY